MKRRAFSSLSAATAVLAMVAACGGGDAADPYPRATLRTLTRGRPAPSVGFRYMLVNPTIESVYRNVGLLRDGNMVEFITGRNLEDKLGGASGGANLAVVKEFSPFVHFRVERVFSARDTTFLTPGAVFLPQVVDATAFSTAPYERIDLDGLSSNRADALRALENRKLRFSCPITEEGGSGGRYFALHGRNAKFRVAAVSDGMGVVLRLLAARGHSFDGGVVLTAAGDNGSAVGSGFAGTVQIEWVRYGRRVVSG